MSSIEEKAIQTYQSNLNYLQANYPDLHKQIILLQSLIESGQYTEKYALEYMNEGYFDLKEIETGIYLYKMNSHAHAQNMKNFADKKRTGAIFKALKAVRANNAQADIIDNSQLSFHNYLWASIKLINYTLNNTTLQSSMKRVYKSIFIDIGLGIHIPEIVQKLQSQIIFLQEQNIEIFRLSLFVTNYAELSKKCTLYFSILENREEEQKNFLKFLNHGNNYNLYIKYIPFNDLYKEKLQKFQSYVFSQNFINYGYAPILLRFIDSPKYLTQNYNFLNVSKQHVNQLFSTKPVLLLLSGPSSSGNLEWIRKNHERFIIVSALSTCKLLQTIDVTPDIVIHIDPGEATALLFEGIDTKSFFQNTQIILAANVNQDTIEKFEKKQVHIIEQGSKYKKGFSQLTSPSVGEYSYALSLIFAATDIYMLGIDLALDNKSLQSHADFHIGQAQGTIDTNTASLDPRTSVKYIKGNLLEQVPTTSSFALSIQQFNYFTKYFRSDKQNVYNLSDGAYFENTQAVNLHEYDWTELPTINKTDLSSSINDFLLSIGSSELREEDKEILLYQIKEAQNLKKKIQKHQKTKYTDSVKYLNGLSKLGWDLSDMEYKTNSDLAQVYYEYFQSVLSYIYDLFNTQGLTQEKKHIIEMDRILVRQLLKIANTYLEKMKGYIE